MRGERACCRPDFESSQPLAWCSPGQPGRGQSAIAQRCSTAMVLDYWICGPIGELGESSLMAEVRGVWALSRSEGPDELALAV
jgi:hypothetical protein